MTEGIVTSIAENIKSAKQHIEKYAAGLILTPTKKNCTQMAAQLSETHDSIYKTLQKEKLLLPIFPELLIDIVCKFSATRKGWLIIDDTLITKSFAEFLEGAERHFNTAIGRSERGLSVVTISWSDGEITIPLSFEFWVSKDLLGEQYRTKIELAKTLISSMIGVIEFEGVIMDGLYASKEMMLFLNDLNINFDMRMASNRVITLDNGKKTKLRDLSALKMSRNERSKTIFSNWNGIEVYLTAELRINKRGEKSVVFIVSNWKALPKKHVQVYAIRWKTEMFYRTSKQYLGLQQCSSRAIEKQKVHIYNIFYAYAFLSIERERAGFCCVEDVIKHYQELKPKCVIQSFRAFGQFFEKSA